MSNRPSRNLLLASSWERAVAKSVLVEGGRTENDEVMEGGGLTGLGPLLEGTLLGGLVLGLALHCDGLIDRATLTSRMLPR